MGWLSEVIGILRAPSVLIKSFLTPNCLHLRKSKQSCALVANVQWRRQLTTDWCSLARRSLSRFAKIATNSQTNKIPTLCAPFFLKRLSYCCLACQLICVGSSGFLFILSKYNIGLNIIFFLKYCQRQIGLFDLKFGFMLKLATLRMRKVNKK